MDKEEATRDKKTIIPKQHIEGWTQQEHYTNIGHWCGQSCPCCRALLGELWGACSICSKIEEYNKL